MPSADARSRSRWLLALTLLAPIALVAWWFWQRPPEASPSRFEAALDRAIAPVLELHAAEAKLGLASPGQARRLARQLAMDSVPYLAPADLDLWAATRLDVARASEASCARLWKGADDDFLARAISGLGDDKLRAYSEMLARGLAIRLERKPPQLPAPSAIARGFAAVAQELPTAERAAFEADVSASALGDARACQLFLTLSGGAQKLEPTPRTELYRALAGQLRSSSPPEPAPERR